MNVNDYLIPEVTKDTTVRTNYTTLDSIYDGKFPEGSEISIKSRPDAVGTIDRKEDGNLIIKIFGETYRIPPEKFESLFFIRTKDSPENWYSRMKND